MFIHLQHNDLNTKWQKDFNQCDHRRLIISIASQHFPFSAVWAFKQVTWMHNIGEWRILMGWRCSAKQPYSFVRRNLQLPLFLFNLGLCLFLMAGICQFFNFLEIVVFHDGLLSWICSKVVYNGTVEYLCPF